MADRDFDDINSLINEVKNEITDVLYNEVYEEIKKVELEHVKSDIWDAYPQRKYKWRTVDGIDDEENIEKEINVNGDEIELTVTNETKPAKKGSGHEYLDEILEYGIGEKKLPYQKPRPFIERTEKELRKGKVVEKILKEELDYID